MRDLLCSPNSRPAWVPHWQEVPSSALLALARQGVDFLPDALVLWIHISLVIVFEGAQFDCDCKRKALPASPCVHEQILEIAIQLGGSAPPPGDLIHHARKALRQKVGAQPGG